MSTTPVLTPKQLVLLPSHNGQRLRLSTLGTDEIQIVVGEGTDWATDTSIEVLNDNMAVNTYFIPGSNVFMNPFDGETIKAGEYGRVTNNSDGSWDLHIYRKSLTLYTDGVAGQILSSQGAGLEPAWIDPNPVANSTFVAQVSQMADGSLDTSLFGNWNSPLVLSASPDISVSNIPSQPNTNIYTFNANGTYQICITVTANVSAGWPLSAGQIHYGTKLTLPGMPITGFERSQYTRTCPDMSGGPQMAGPFPGDYGDPNIQSWTDTFTITASASQQMLVGVFAAAYSSFDAVSYAHNISITRLTTIPQV